MTKVDMLECWAVDAARNSQEHQRRETDRADDSRSYLKPTARAPRRGKLAEAITIE